MILARFHPDTQPCQPYIVKITTGELSVTVKEFIVTLDVRLTSLDHYKRARFAGTRAYDFDHQQIDIARNRFLIWCVSTFVNAKYCKMQRRVDGDTLTLEEHSFDTNLSHNQLCIQFVNSAIVNSGVTVIVRGHLVLLLITTINAVYRFELPHPASKTEPVVKSIDLYCFCNVRLFRSATHQFLHFCPNASTRYRLCIGRR